MLNLIILLRIFHIHIFDMIHFHTLIIVDSKAIQIHSLQFYD